MRLVPGKRTSEGTKEAVRHAHWIGRGTEIVPEFRQPDLSGGARTADLPITFENGDIDTSLRKNNRGRQSVGARAYNGRVWNSLSDSITTFQEYVSVPDLQTIRFLDDDF